MATEGDLAALQRFLGGPDAGLPKYLRLRNALAAAIAEDHWKSGARIPTEERLTQATGLSLGTVQRALRTLVDDGLVVRRHGAGTFVAGHEKPMHAPFQHCRFLDDQGAVLPIYSKFLRRGAPAAPGEWSNHLAAADAMCIERTFSINDEFLIYTHLYFDPRHLPALAKASPAKLSGVNVKALIAREHHISLGRFSETMQVAVFPDAVCEAIGVKRRTSGAILQIVARDRSGGFVYFQDLYIPPTRRRLFIA